MYLPPGFWKDALGDIEVIAHEEALHAFHLVRPNAGQMAHIVSRDGLTWERMPVALRTGDPGSFDDDGIWTMGVFRHADRFFMLYAGVSGAEGGKIQRIGVATSNDLVAWKKHEGNPVICADPRWYEARMDDKHRVDWRDPHVWVEDGVLHGVACARSNEGPANRRGCVARFVSRDGYHWEVKPPIQIGSCYDFETPCLFELNGRYYLTGIRGHNRVDPGPNVYRVADRIEGPFRRLPHDELLPGGNLVYKACRWKGQTLLFHFMRGTLEGTDDFVHLLAPPKVADTLPDGSLILRPFRSWDPVVEMPMKSLLSNDGERAGWSSEGVWTRSESQLEGACAPGFGAFLFPSEGSNVILEAEIESRGAHQFGVLLRADQQADRGTFVSFAPGARRLTLYTLSENYKTSSPGTTYRYRGQRVVQETHLPHDPAKKVRLRLVACGPYVEASVDDRVCISATTLAIAGQNIGVFAEDGAISVHALRRGTLQSPPGFRA